MGTIRRGWYERQEAQEEGRKRITQDWVKTNCKLTRREKELLQLVYDRKLVRRDHLEVISESYRGIGVNRTTILNRAIRKLYRNMVLDKVHETQRVGEGNSPSIVAIDKAGSIILGVPHKTRITHLVSNVKGTSYVTRRLPANYRHINGVNQTEVDTLLFFEEIDGKIVRWCHEVATSFMNNGEQISFIPDVIMELEIKGKWFGAFVEYDTGSEDFRRVKDFPTIYKKLQNYRKYYRSNLWKDEYKYFPLILFVTEDEKRIDYFNTKCKELNLQGFGIYHKSYTNFLDKLYETF